uniref:Uncharacterized protein n=1 Tax=Anguilla anguilla TaxID=7936 RepID=A0A0E9QJH0_ANGAN
MGFSPRSVLIYVCSYTHLKTLKIAFLTEAY